MRKQNTETLGEVLRQVLRENRLDTGLHEVQLIGAWEMVLGSYIKNYTEDLYIKNKVLYAKISSAALRHELFLSRKMLVDNLNRAVGTQVITDIRLL